MSFRMPRGLIVFGFFCLFTAGVVILSRIPERPPEAGPPTLARIIDIRIAISHIDSFAVLSLRGEDGSAGTDSMATDRLNCRVGDIVPARKVGVLLKLAGEACRRPPGPREAKVVVKMPNGNEI